MIATRRHLLRGAALIGAGAAALGACTRRAVQREDVLDRPFVGSASSAIRANQIKRAGAGRGWAMTDVRPGLIRGTLNVRDHTAVVDIPYDSQRFSIRYVDSRNLGDDGTGGIHPNYNSWVRLLANDIVAQPPV